eukprot:s1402_g5.t1
MLLLTQIPFAGIFSFVLMAILTYYRNKLRVAFGMAGANEPVLDYSYGASCRSCFEYFCLPPCSSRCLMTFKNLVRKNQANVVEVADARTKEAEEGLSKRDFFEKYGFVLLKHESKMTAEDWLADSILLRNPQGPNPSTKVRTIYAKEIEPLIRELLPSAAEICFPSRVVRRGPGGPSPFYAYRVHQDFGLYPEDMIHFGDGFEGFLKRCHNKDTAGYVLLNFWRPIPPTAGPVRSTPLAVCDPNTVRVEDCVPIKTYGLIPGGQHSLVLKHNADQKWYYYPDMTTDEILVLRQFHYERGMEAPYNRIKTIFHAAFKHPASSPKDEVRYSSEYRVGVWLK